MRQCAVLVALVALWACSSHEEPTKQEPPVERSVHHLDAPPAVLPHHEYTRLLEPGAEPRSVVRYALTAGTLEARATSTLRSRTYADARWSEWTDRPASDGFSVTVDPPQLVVDRRFSAKIDDRGQLGPVGGSDADVTQRLLAMIVQLPEEPIGVGATWRVVDVLRQHPAIVKQTASYRLLARTPTTLTIDVSIVRNGQQQTVEDPTLPAGTTAELQALHRTLTGTVEVDLARPLCTGRVTLDARMHVKLQPPGAPLVEQMFEDTGTIDLGH